jgi:hypothetical protein
LEIVNKNLQINVYMYKEQSSIICFSIYLKSWSLYLNMMRIFDGTLCYNNDDDHDVCKLQNVFPLKISMP